MSQNLIQLTLSENDYGEIDAALTDLDAALESLVAALGIDGLDRLDALEGWWGAARSTPGDRRVDPVVLSASARRLRGGHDGAALLPACGRRPAARRP